MNKVIKVICFACLLATIGQCQIENSVDKTNRVTDRQESSLFDTRPAIWDATIYIHKKDSLFAGKVIPTSKKAEPDLMMLPDSLRQLPYELALSSFNDNRKKELGELKQWFGFTIYLDSAGVLQELKYTLPNKFRNADSSLCINESDLLRLGQTLKGLKLVLPEWWKELGYASIDYVIKFDKLETTN